MTGPGAWLPPCSLQSRRNPSAENNDAWVLLRHETDSRHLALSSDEDVAHTSGTEVTGAEFERFTEIGRIEDNPLLA